MTPKIMNVRNVNHALVEGLWWLRTAGVIETSRNGGVLVAPGPVLTVYRDPTERVLFNPLRDANPVFHLMEALWMLAGRDDLQFMAPFNARFAEYAEADGRIHGAYGKRWRWQFTLDQLWAIVYELQAKPDSRRAVLQMWSADRDLGTHYRDVPCNTHAYFDLRGGKLNMTVCCRSNDAVWGAYGANAVHFSILQEVLAHELGAPVGTYTQMSNNFHIYPGVPQIAKLYQGIDTVTNDPYLLLRPTRLLQPGESMKDFLLDCEALCNGETEFDTWFFNVVAWPLKVAYLQRKAGAQWVLSEECSKTDWGQAFLQWVARRNKEQQ